MDDISPHAKREQRRQEREESRKQKEKQQAARQQRKNMVWVLVTLLVLVAFAGGIGWLYTHKPEMYTPGEVHWHALVDITICGEHHDLPTAEHGRQVHGQQFLGTHLMHTHDDNTIHIEGQVRKKEDITLGNFFDSIDVPFSSTQFMEYRNGEECPDGPGTWHMYVNDKPRTDFNDYVLAAAQDAGKQVIKLVFAPDT